MTRGGIVFVKPLSRMRKTLAITLIAIHLLGNTEAAQLFKLPTLISHYFQHRQLDPSVTFIDFLAMHYVGDDGTPADDDIDNQLPYHHVDNHCLSVVYYPSDQYVFNIDMTEHSTEYGSRLISGHPSEHVSLILQPPRDIQSSSSI